MIAVQIPVTCVYRYRSLELAKHTKDDAIRTALALADIGGYVKCSGPSFYGMYNVKLGTTMFFHYEKRKKIRGWVLSIYIVPMNHIISAKQHDRHFTVILKNS